MHPLTASRASPLHGTVTVPGDKSISHRALMFAALAIGETRITGLLEGEDVLRTAAAMRALGAHVTQDEPGHWRVTGAGLGGLAEPADVLDMGNSGTAARLLAGILATHPIFAVLTGDASPAPPPDGARHHPARPDRRTIQQPRRRPVAGWPSPARRMPCRSPTACRSPARR